MNHLQLLETILNTQKMVRFNRYTGVLNVDIDWETSTRPGTYLVVDCYRALDPQEFIKIYNDHWLKQYVTALFKRQWGANLIKYDNMLLPGGVSLNGRQIFDDANSDIKDLEDELLTKSAPLEWFVG
jgi:hypothetical protein